MNDLAYEITVQKRQGEHASIHIGHFLRASDVNYSNRTLLARVNNH